METLALLLAGYVAAKAASPKPKPASPLVPKIKPKLPDVLLPKVTTSSPAKAAASTAEIPQLPISQADFNTGVQQYAVAKERFFLMQLAFFRQNTAAYQSEQAELDDLGGVILGAIEIVAGAVLTVTTGSTGLLTKGIKAAASAVTTEVAAAQVAGIGPVNLHVPIDPQWGGIGLGPHNAMGFLFPDDTNGAKSSDWGRPENQFTSKAYAQWCEAMLAKYGPVKAQEGILAVRNAYLTSAQGEGDWLQFLVQFWVASSTASNDGNVLISGEALSSQEISSYAGRPNENNTDVPIFYVEGVDPKITANGAALTWSTLGLGDFMKDLNDTLGQYWG